MLNVEVDKSIQKALEKTGVMLGEVSQGQHARIQSSDGFGIPSYCLLLCGLVRQAKAK
jgi:hypothetical protein